MTPYKAEIFWIDHASTRGWNSPKTDSGLIKMHSIGWVVDERKDCIIISDTQDQNGYCRDQLAVARKLITKIKKLK